MLFSLGVCGVPIQRVPEKADISAKRPKRVKKETHFIVIKRFFGMRCKPVVIKTWFWQKNGACVFESAFMLTLFGRNTLRNWHFYAWDSTPILHPPPDCHLKPKRKSDACRGLVHELWITTQLEIFRKDVLFLSWSGKNLLSQQIFTPWQRKSVSFFVVTFIR